VLNKLNSKYTKNEVHFIFLGSGNVYKSIGINPMATLQTIIKFVFEYLRCIPTKNMSLLKSLLKKGGDKSNDLLCSLTFDMHSHLLPGIDDGAATIEDSIVLIKALIAMGYKAAITTPHSMEDSYRNTPEIILGKLAEVRQRLIEEGIDFQLDAAAEYYVDSFFEENLKDNNLLIIGKNSVLIETSYLNECQNIFEIIFNMQSNGYQPILAHPERYIYMYGRHQWYQELWDKGVHFQVNLGSLLGYYSPDSKLISEKLLKEGKINYLATDIHHQRHIRVMETARKSDIFKQIIKLPLLNESLWNSHQFKTLS